MLKILLNYIILDFAINNFFDSLNKNFPNTKKLNLDPNDLSIGTFTTFYISGSIRQVKIDARINYITDDGMIIMQSIYDGLPITIFVIRDSVYNLIGAGANTLYDYVGR